jgi:hypothetical protein
MTVTDGFLDALQRAIRERAALTLNTLDSPFSAKSAQTLKELADYVGAAVRRTHAWAPGPRSSDCTVFEPESAAAVPPSATNKAISATTIAGEGRALIKCFIRRRRASRPLRR